MFHRFTLKCQIFTFYRIYLSTKESPSMIKVRIFTYYIVKSVKIPMVSDNLMLQFKDDAYLPADEPLGSIEATLSLITFLAFALLI